MLQIVTKKSKSVYLEAVTIKYQATKRIGIHILYLSCVGQGVY